MRGKLRPGVSYFQGDIQVMKISILIDGGFNRKQSYYLRGDKTPADRANELYAYYMSHIRDERTDDAYQENRKLFRIFYYDCPLLKKSCLSSCLKKGS